ncbi:MAG: O-antigen ligase family protein [Gaiellaceae bacterium]|jgi:O-antigen ligase
MATRSPAIAVIGPHSTARLLPPWTLALSLNGFFLYLAVLRLLGRAPRTATTGAWYALVGLLCLIGVWLNRETLIRRLAVRSRPATTYVLAGVALAGWFLLNVVLLSHGSLSRTLAALLVLWTLPSAALALSLPREAIRTAAAAIGALGVLFALIELGALAHDPHATRFSPIAHLDPISAAQYPALGAIALLALTPRTLRTEVARAVAVALLCAGAVLPGSRGPVVALCVAVVVAAAFLRRRAWLLLGPAIVAGLVLGYGGTRLVGSSTYLTSSIPGASGLGGSGSESSGNESDKTSAQQPQQPPPISTMHIRREWWTSAIEAIPSAPIVGHGVAMFVDNTPEAKRMGVAGERTYPHNSPLESLYSLGLLGALPYLALLAAGVAALVLLGRRPAGPPLVFAAGLYAFAFVSSNLSGEIGADAPLWAAGALAVALYAEPTAASR